MYLYSKTFLKVPFLKKKTFLKVKTLSIYVIINLEVKCTMDVDIPYVRIIMVEIVCSIVSAIVIVDMWDCPHVNLKPFPS